MRVGFFSADVFLFAVGIIGKESYFRMIEKF